MIRLQKQQQNELKDRQKTRQHELTQTQEVTPAVLDE